MFDELKTEEIIRTLPDHSVHLRKIERLAKKAMDKYYDSIRPNSKVFLADDQIQDIEYLIGNLLQGVGDLSMTRADLMTPLALHYKERYKDSPEMGKKLFIKKYEDITEPYDKLKDKLWKYIAELNGDEKI